MYIVTLSRQVTGGGICGGAPATLLRMQRREGGVEQGDGGVCRVQRRWD